MRPEPIINFPSDDSIRDLSAFNASRIYEEYNLSPNIVDILSFDQVSIQSITAQGMIFKGKMSGLYHNFTMDVDPGYKYIKKFRGDVQWYMMKSEAFISSISIKLKNEKNDFELFNGQSIKFILSIKEI